MLMVEKLSIIRLFCFFLLQTQIYTTEEPVNTTEEPGTTTEEPATTPEEPATTPEEPATTPEEPATTTEEIVAGYPYVGCFPIGALDGPMHEYEDNDPEYCMDYCKTQGE